MGVAPQAKVLEMDADTRWHALFAAHRKPMLRAAFRVTGSVADAEDAVQGVFVKLLRRETVAPEICPAYLRRAAVNAALDLVRARARDVELGVAGEDSAAPTSTDPRLKTVLRAALRRLPAQSAEIFVLRHFEDLRNREIATLLGLTQIQVAVTLHRARKQLQRELAGFYRSQS